MPYLNAANSSQAQYFIAATYSNDRAAALRSRSIGHSHRSTLIRSRENQTVSRLLGETQSLGMPQGVTGPHEAHPIELRLSDRAKAPSSSCSRSDF